MNILSIKTLLKKRVDRNEWKNRNYKNHNSLSFFTFECLYFLPYIGHSPENSKRSFNVLMYCNDIICREGTEVQGEGVNLLTGPEVQNTEQR